MEHNRAKMLHALAESFGFVERPCPFGDDQEAVRFRAWERASQAIDALKKGGGNDEYLFRVIVLTCGQLGATEAQANAACMASALGFDLGPVLQAA